MLVAPAFSLISSGTETADIHRDGILKEVADNPSHVRKVLDVMMQNGPAGTIREVRAKFSDYAVLGYSGAGVVIDVHPSVTDLAVGDRVAYGGQGTGHGECIMTGRNLVARLPDEVPFEHACFATLGSIALNAVRIANLSLGDTVVVVGLGLVGQLIAQLARLQGGSVIATDLNPTRTALAREMGADQIVAGGDGAEAAVASLTGGRGADCVIVAAAAKSAAPAQAALRMVRDRGRIVVVGAVEMSFPWEQMYMKEVQLLMARAYGPGSYDPVYEQQGRDYPLPYVRWTENRNMEEFLRLVGTGRVQLDPLITHRFALDEAPAAYDVIMTPGTTSLAVLLRYPAADRIARATEDVTPGAPVYAPTRRVDIPANAAGHPGKFKVALAGAGNISRWAHLPALKALDDVVLHAVYSSGGARGKSYGLRFGAAFVTSSYDELLRDPNVDAVLVASRNQHHARETLAALRAGKHVFVEKPMALTEDECREIVAVERDTGRTVMVGFNRRFAPFYVEQKRQLARRSGPAVINCRVNSPGISGGYWMADPAIGGAILGEACHFTDLFAWMLDSEPVEVVAFSLPTDVPEPVGINNMTAAFRFADGSVANLTYCTVGSRTSGGERVEAFAAGVGVVTEDFKRLVINGSTRRTRSRMFADKGYAPQMAEFVAAARGGRPSSVPASAGARSTLMCLRMIESAQAGGRPMAIDLAGLLAPAAAAAAPIDAWRGDPTPALTPAT
ncbi:bi-domain-containing oxidoreductase [Roseisolibacter agri]|uniref:bi-domain-containing oxidoreductase n=1 Tax=Roseisolibacter agri TaxID=2014610 RepID=UPI0024E155CE|nr:bi-domain-containing oxidoreductase [Roseisolibacter agri]